MLDQLSKLYGIGKGKAAVIVEYRKENGGFKSLEELKQVPGIGEKLFSANRNRITITPPETAP